MGCSASVDTAHKQAAHNHPQKMPNRTESGGIEDVTKALALTDLEAEQHDIYVRNWDLRIRHLVPQEETLTAHQKDLIRESWGYLEADFVKASEMFYHHLFLIYPTSKALFHRSNKNYEKMALSMFKTCVNGINDILYNNAHQKFMSHVVFDQN